MGYTDWDCFQLFEIQLFSGYLKNCIRIEKFGKKN